MAKKKYGKTLIFESFFLNPSMTIILRRFKFIRMVERNEYAFSRELKEKINKCIYQIIWHHRRFLFLQITQHMTSR